MGDKEGCAVERGGEQCPGWEGGMCAAVPSVGCEARGSDERVRCGPRLILRHAGDGVAGRRGEGGVGCDEVEGNVEAEDCKRVEGRPSGCVVVVVVAAGDV